MTIIYNIQIKIIKIIIKIKTNLYSKNKNMTDEKTKTPENENQENNLEDQNKTVRTFLFILITMKLTYHSPIKNCYLY